MSLLNKLKGNAKVAELGYGIHKNCIIQSATNEVRKTKDGSIVKRSCYTTIAQVDDKGKVVSNRTISWFNVDPTSDMAYDNLFTQLDQTTELMDILYPPVSEEEGSEWDTAFAALLKEYDVDETEASLRKVISKSKTSKPFMAALGDLYASMVNEKSGKDSPKFKFKLVFDKSTVYIQLPRFGQFSELMGVKTTKLGFSDNELEFKAKSDKTASAVAGNTSIGSL
tara:strand:- start:2519 stop:3193 length:675 start_codon:yes stop_codon:yes gene_type:complete